MPEPLFTTWHRSTAWLAVLLMCGIGRVASAAHKPHPLAEADPQSEAEAADDDLPSSWLAEVESEPLFENPDSFIVAQDDFSELGKPEVQLTGFTDLFVPDPTAPPTPPQLHSTAFEWELLPDGLMYHSYLAGEKEPRFAGQWLWDDNRGQVWDTALGGRWGIARCGTPGPLNPEGFQLDFEGGAMARVDLEEESDLEAVDFRVGIVGTWHFGPWRTKTGYYHLSSHIGDEFLIKNPLFRRRNYVRDALLAAVMYDLTEELQVYGEAAYAANANGGAEPLEFQFGAQFNKQSATGPKGFPFAAVNSHWRQEFDSELSTNIMAGWMWRGKHSNHIYRIGYQHYNGRSLQYELFDRYENLNGFGIWFDY